MTSYSREPPRRDCVLHPFFGSLSDGGVVDMSPQGHEVAADESGVSLVPGVVGTGLSFEGSVDHAVAVTFDDSDVSLGFTASMWIDPRDDRITTGDNAIVECNPGSSGGFQIRVDASGNVVVQYTFDDGTTTGELTATTVSAGDDPVLVSTTFDPNVSTPVNVFANEVVTASSSAGVGTSLTLDDEIRFGGSDGAGAGDSRYVGLLDDLRLYSTALNDSHIVDIHSIGVEHNSVEDVADGWENDGIPFREENRQMGGALSEENYHVKRQLDFVRQAHHVDDASGVQLDRIGLTAGVRRKENEGDARYRARIKATIIAGRSSGTFDDILSATTSILGTTEDSIELNTDLSADPATALIYVHPSVLDATPLTTSDLTTVLSDVVLGGHQIEVVRQGSDPFTFIDDAMVNDPDNGLTSDSTQTGGGLTSDI